MAAGERQVQGEIGHQRPLAPELPKSPQLVGLVLEASTQTAGVPGKAATWVAPTGTPAARAPGVAVAPACARSPRGPGPCFLGGRAVLLKSGHLKKTYRPNNLKAPVCSKRHWGPQGMADSGMYSYLGAGGP
jgi:hypothetical protein